MNPTKLSHEDIVRFNHLADNVQDRTRKRIDFLRQRTTELDGLTADREFYRHASQPMKNHFGAVLTNPAAEPDKDKRAKIEEIRAQRFQELCALVQKARDKVPEAIVELNELWKEQIDLFVRAKCNFLTFFRVVNLQPQEQVCYTHTYRTEVGVSYIGEDGGPRTQKAVKAQKQTYFDLRELHSNDVGYQLRDINLGPDIAGMAQATVDIAWDLEAKLNSLAKTMHLSLLGAFTTSGTKLSRTYVPNEYINTSNLPTTNVLECSSNGAATLFRLDGIRKIMKYAQQWGDIWGEPITPTGLIYIASIDSTNLSEELTPTGTAANPVADRIVDGNYLRIEWFNRLWTLVPDVTLAPGTCYPVLSQPVGDVFFKPSMDEVFVETNRRKNWETRSAMKVVQFASPQPKRVNACSLAYRT